jgi:molecular chaperone GrpE (heat shock protein)
MSKPNLVVVMEKEDEYVTAVEEHVLAYLKSLYAIEQAIEPYKEQKKELRKEYIDSGKLTRDELWAAVKAYRIYKASASMEDLNDMFDLIEKKFGPA